MRRSVRFLLAAAIAVQACGKAAPQEEPAQTVDRLITSRHGLIKLNPEDRKRLEAVERDPDRYLLVIEGSYIPPDVASLASDRSTARRFTVVASLVAKMPTARARALLTSWYLRLDDAAADPTRADDRPRLTLMRNAALSGLGSARIPSIVDRILSRLERMDVPQRAESLEYLFRSSARDATVVARLRAMYESSTSPLHGAPDLASVLDAMQRQ